MKFDIYRFDSVTSTNSLLKEGDYPIGAVAFAKSQTHGRGRGGKSFISPPSGLYMSAVVGFGSVLEKLFIPIKIAVLVSDVLSKYVTCEIKWPNDILTEGKKLCGILCESYNNKVVFGIGINVNTKPHYFAENNLPYATSLFAATSVLYDIDDIFNQILRALTNHQSQADIINRYKEKCLMLGKEITVKQGDNIYNALAVDITANGELVVLADGQQKIINSGEVSVRSYTI